MSNDFHNLVQTTLDLDELKPKAVEDVTSRALTVLKIVENLESYLVNKDESKRLKGTSFLASVLSEIPKDLLDENEVDVLTAFFCDRLKDHFSVIPAALQGLQAVTDMTNMPSTAPDLIIISLTQNITCQALHQSSRNSFYCILRNMFYNKFEVIHKKPGDFVYTVISGMDSESDPRNLIFLFAFLPDLFKKLEFKHLAEEAFTVLECYFPVDFNSGEKGAITRDDLSQGLENCFLSCEDFGPYIIPMALEKMESSLKLAHMDSLKLLINGFQNWTIEDINPQVMNLWNACKALILPSADLEVAEMANKALVALIQTYASSPLSSSQSETLKQLLNDILTSTSRFLNDPTLSLFLPATKLLSAISQASSVSCRHIIIKIIPQLLVLISYKSSNEFVLAALCVMLNASIKFNLWDKDENVEVTSVLFQTPNVLISKLNDPLSRHGSFLCLNEIIPVLTPEMRLQIMNTLLDIIPQPNFTERDSCQKFISDIALEYPDEIKENLLSKLNINENLSKVGRKSDVLCWCTNVPTLTEYSIQEIVKNLATPNISSIIIKCLRDHCEKSAQEVVLHCFGTEIKLVQQLLNFAKVIDSSEKEIIFDYSKTIEAITRSLLQNEQQELIEECLSLFTDETFFNNHLILLQGLVVPLRVEVRVPNGQSLIKKLSESYLSYGNDSLVIIASMINKYEDGDELNSILNMLYSNLNSILTSGEVQMKKAAASLCSCVTKSLILRGHRLSSQWLDKLIELFDDEDLQLSAADGFKHILSQSEHLNEKNYCTIKLLYKQRIFCNIKKLITFLDDERESKRSAVALAIAYILQSVPKSLIIAELKELIKVIVNCVESSDQNVAAAILEVVANLLESGEDVFEGYIQTFIPKCLKCISSSKMAVRMWSLDCLFYYGKYDETKILPYRKMVLDGVQTCLDDQKRLVRQKAVRVRTRWFLVGSSQDK